MIDRLSTGELICVPFLDSEIPGLRAAADEQLHQRGYPRLVIRILRGISFIGLWHQFLFLWEEWHLDLADVAVGYAMIFAGVGLLSAVLGLFGGWTRIALAGVTFIALAVLLGVWSVRHWSRSRKQSQPVDQA